MIMSKQIVLKSLSQQLILTKRRITGNFCLYLCEDGTELDVVVTGRLQHVSEPPSDFQQENVVQENEKDEVKLTKEEVVEVLSHFNYQLGPQFQAFKEIKLSNKGFTGKVEWTGSMVTFLDSLFKLVLLLNMEKAGRFLYPSSFRSLFIDAPFFFQLKKGTELDVHYDSRNNILCCKGLRLAGLITSPDPFFQGKTTPLMLTHQSFVPFHREDLKVKELLAVSLQLVAESALSRWRNEDVEISVIEIKEDNGTHSLIHKAIKEATNSLPHVRAKLEVLNIRQAKEKLSFKQMQNYLVVGSYDSLQQLVGVIDGNVFLLAHVYGSQSLLNKPTSLSNDPLRITDGPQRLANGPLSIGNSKELQVGSNESSLLKPILTHHVKAGEKLVLLKKQINVHQLRILLLEHDKWFTDLGHLFNGCDNGQPVVVVSRKWKPAEVLPLLARQKYAHRLRCVFLDKFAPEFSMSSSLFYNHLSLGLSNSQLRHKVWGFDCTLEVDLGSTIGLGKIQGTITSSDSNLDVKIIGLNTTTVTYKPDEPPEQVDIKYMDYCGTNSSGEEVMGLAQFDSLTNHITPDRTLAWTLPPDWVVEEGATVPAAYTLAYYCCHVKAKVKPGMSVLVHAGTCLVSQACVAVALDAGADLSITVESEDHSALLLQTFPQLKEDQMLPLHCYNTKLRARNKTVQLVINCLRKTEIALSLECVDFDAHFIHLSSSDVREREFVGLIYFLKNLALHGISLTSIFDADIETKKKLHFYLKNGLEKGIVKPLRKQLFTIEEDSLAISHLKLHSFDEKTLIKMKRTCNNKPLRSIYNIHCDPHESYIIVASEGELWLDVVEWLVQQGACKLVVAVDQGNWTYSCSGRLDKLIAKPNLHISVTSVDRLNSSVGALDFINEAHTIGPVSAIFCITMEENCASVSHLDCASQLLVPPLKQFVCLLGGSASVCESRAHLGLPVCLIQSKSLLARPQVILPYLPYVLTEHRFTGHIFKVSQAGSFTYSQDGDINVTQDLQSLLPSSITELLKLADEVSEAPTLREVVTRSPLHKDVMYCLLPVFVIPGIHSESIKHFMRHLMHPTYCVYLPARQSSVKNTAQALLQEVLRVQQQGPYNLVAETWSGALALQLGVLLEARGHQAELFLLDAAPTTTKHCARLLCDRDNSLNVNLLSTLLNLDSQKVRQLEQVGCSWEEQLKKALHLVQPTPEVAPEVMQPLTKALTALWSHLTALLEYNPPMDLFKGGVHLIRPKDASDSDFCGLYQVYCQQKPTVHVVDDECHTAMVKNRACVKIVNENLVFSWEL